MAAALDLHPDTGHPVLTGVAEVHRLLDAMHAGATEPLASGEHARAVTEIERAGRRLDALRLKVLATADRAGAAQSAGFAGTEAWVAQHTQTSRSTAARDVALATALTPAPSTAPSARPGSAAPDPGATAEALDAGLLSPGHAAVILGALDRLPPGVGPEQRRVVEAVLVDKARRFAPDQLRRIARRVLEAVEPDPSVVDAHENQLVATEEEQARDKCSLTFHDNTDGTVTGHFTLPTLAAAILRKVIDSLTAPRRMREQRDHHAAARSTDQSPAFDWRHRRGLAFAELLEHLPTDHLHPKTAATVVVTLDHTTLTGALKAAHLDTGDTLSAGQARRLACTAGILPAILGSGSVALDLGRETRLFTAAQRIAAGLSHDTCAADGCDRPYAWCELHHRQPWSTGGRTDLKDAVPLCHWHHQRIHDHTYTHRRLPEGSLRFTRRT